MENQRTKQFKSCLLSPEHNQIRNNSIMVHNDIQIGFGWGFEYDLLFFIMEYISCCEHDEWHGFTRCAVFHFRFRKMKLRTVITIILIVAIATSLTTAKKFRKKKRKTHKDLIEESAKIGQERLDYFKKKNPHKGLYILTYLWIYLLFIRLFLSCVLT